MKPRKAPASFSILEAFLPLVFFSGTRIFWAAGAALVLTITTLLVFELLRKQDARVLEILYLFWIITCGACVWLIWGLPPYWILCAHLLVPETVRAPSAAQRAKPFGFGIKKYASRRTHEVSLVFLGVVAFSFFIYRAHDFLPGFSVWIFAGLALGLGEAVLKKNQKRKK